MALEELWKASHLNATCLAGPQKVWCSALTEETGKMNFSRAQQYKSLSNTSSMLCSGVGGGGVFWFFGRFLVWFFVGFVVVVSYIVLELISEKGKSFRMSGNS